MATSEQQQQQQPGSMLAASLHLLLALCQPACAKQLYRRNVTGLLEMLSLFLDDEIVRLVAQMYGRLAGSSGAVLQEVSEGRLVLGMLGMLGSGREALMLRALALLSANIGQFSGADFARLVVGPAGALPMVYSLLGAQQQQGADPVKITSAREAHNRNLSSTSSDTAAHDQVTASEAPSSDTAASTGPSLQLMRAAGQVLLAALERARQAGGLKGRQVPRGGHWGAISPLQLLQLEDRCKAGWPACAAAGRAADAPAAAASGSSAGGSATAAASPSSSTVPSSASGGKRASSRAATGSSTHAAWASKAHSTQQQQQGAEYDEDGLRVVWASAPAEEVLAARRAWQAVPLRERLTWHQTSSEVHVSLRLPAGELLLAAVHSACRAVICWTRLSD